MSPLILRDLLVGSGASSAAAHLLPKHSVGCRVLSGASCSPPLHVPEVTCKRERIFNAVLSGDRKNLPPQRRSVVPMVYLWILHFTVQIHELSYSVKKCKW